MKKCQSICDIDDWCMCEAVQSLETKIEEDIKDLSLKDKKNYFSFLNEIKNNYISPSFQNVRKIHYPVYGKHTLGDALKCKNCGCDSHCGKVCERKEKHHPVDGGGTYNIEVCKECRCEACK